MTSRKQLSAECEPTGIRRGPPLEKLGSHCSLTKMCFSSKKAAVLLSYQWMLTEQERTGWIGTVCIDASCCERAEQTAEALLF